MKITKAKVIRELEKNHGWSNLNVEGFSYIEPTAIISDVLKVVNDLLFGQNRKGIR